MAVVYGQKRFNNPEAMRVVLTAIVTGGVGSSGNAYFDTVNAIGKSDVGSVISVTSGGVGVILANKASVDLTDGKTYYLIAEVPTAQDATDFYFVGIVLKSQYDVDNLIVTKVQSDWATQYIDLRTTGVK